jgi:magnesium and cobalt transporter
MKMNNYDPESFIPKTMTWLKHLFKKLTGKEPDSSVRETIEELIEEADESEPSIESDERVLLGNVLNLRDLTAQDVMIPRSEIVAISVNISDEELMKTFADSGLTAVIVFRNTLDDTVGMLHLKDAWIWNLSGRQLPVAQLVREVLFVSPTMRTLDLLLKMRESGTRMAMVVDEYGGIDGLVTFSALIEEIIGDIQSAGDNLPIDVLVERRDGSAIVDARISLEELSESLSSDFSAPELDDNVDTLGGLVVALVGRVPSQGELIFHHNGLEFEVLEADPRRVKRIRIRGLKK